MIVSNRPDSLRNARKLRAYVIAVNTDTKFRHVDLMREGYGSSDGSRHPVNFAPRALNAHPCRRVLF